jgi:transcriptional regulator with XRE-family HTH domain
MKRGYRSVREMVRSLSDDPGFQEEVERTIEERALGRMLGVLRNAAGLTQAEMADKMQCTQGRISKLEMAAQRSIRIGDLLDYARALDLNFCISFERKSGGRGEQGGEESNLSIRIPDSLEKRIRKAL